MKTQLREILNAPPERLGLFRAALGGFAFVYLLVRAPNFFAVARSSAGSYQPEGLSGWLPFLARAPLDAGIASSLYVLLIALAAAFTFGAFYRWLAPLFALLLLWATSYKSSFGMVFHSENLLTLQVLVVALSPAAQEFSFDARRLKRPTPFAIPPGWPLLAASLIAIFAYLLAGVAKIKLGGVDWMSGDVLRIQVAYDNVRKIELGSLHSPIGAALVHVRWIFAPLAIVTLVAELGGIGALIHRRAALVWVWLIVGFHWGVLLLMAIAFAFPMTGIPFLCFFAIERSRLGRWLLGRASQLRMTRTASLTGLALVLFGCGAQQTHGHAPGESAAASDAQWSADSMVAHLTVAQVKGTHIDDSVLVHAVHVRIDGSLIESCQLEELEQDICGRDISLAPGPHHLAIGISCRNGETLGYSHPNGGACEFTLEEALVVAPGESIQLDLTQASRDVEHFEAALTRSAGPSAPTECLSTLVALAAVNSCTQAGLVEAAELATQAQKQCSGSIEAPNVSEQVAEAYLAHLTLAPERCFSSGALRGELPVLLTRGYSDWPGQGLAAGASTWSWVRAPLMPKANASSPGELAELAPALREAAERAVVFDQLAAVFTPDGERAEGKEQALRAAMKVPFSLDPATLEGHRNVVLIGTETRSGSYQDFVARGIKASDRNHCDRYPLARQVSLFFTREGLTRPEWEAMMMRTPPESRVQHCDYAFREDSGVVPLEERLDWLFRFDCDPTRRHPALLGNSTEVHLRPDTSLSPELRSQFVNKFNSCLAKRCERQSCSWFPER